MGLRTPHNYNLALPTFYSLLEPFSDAIQQYDSEFMLNSLHENACLNPFHLWLVLRHIEILKSLKLGKNLVPQLLYNFEDIQNSVINYRDYTVTSSTCCNFNTNIKGIRLNKLNNTGRIDTLRHNIGYHTIPYYLNRQYTGIDSRLDIYGEGGNFLILFPEGQEKNYQRFNPDSAVYLFYNDKDFKIFIPMKKWNQSFMLNTNYSRVNNNLKLTTIRLFDNAELNNYAKYGFYNYPLPYANPFTVVDPGISDIEILANEEGLLNDVSLPSNTTSFTCSNGVINLCTSLFYPYDFKVNVPVEFEVNFIDNEAFMIAASSGYSIADGMDYDLMIDQIKRYLPQMKEECDFMH